MTNLILVTFIPLPSAALHTAEPEHFQKTILGKIIHLPTNPLPPTTKMDMTTKCKVEPSSLRLKVTVDLPDLDCMNSFVDPLRPVFSNPSLSVHVMPRLTSQLQRQVSSAAWNTSSVEIRKIEQNPQIYFGSEVFETLLCCNAFRVYVMILDKIRT